MAVIEHDIGLFHGEYVRRGKLPAVYVFTNRYDGRNGDVVTGNAFDQVLDH